MRIETRQYPEQKREAVKVGCTLRRTADDTLSRLVSRYAFDKGE
jgi:hypothetical protein